MPLYSKFTLKMRMVSIKEENYPNSFGRTYEEEMSKTWAWLSKVVEHTGGIKFNDMVDDTDLFKKAKAAIGTEKVNVFVNYGSINSPKSFLEPRKWLPAVEAAGRPAETSKLKAGRIDNLVAPTPDDKSEEDVQADFFA